MIHPYLLPPIPNCIFTCTPSTHIKQKHTNKPYLHSKGKRGECTHPPLFLSNTLNELLQLKVIGNGPHLIIHSINGVKPRTFSGIFSRFTQLRIRSIGAEVNTGCNNLP